MKKLFLLLSISLLAVGVTTAQNQTFFSHYQVAPIIANPAFAGFNQESQILFNARAQWTGFPDAPQSIGAQFHTNLGQSFGIGVAAFSESAARLTSSEAKLNFAFRIPLSDFNKNTLSLGLSTEFRQQSVGNNTLFENFYQLGDNIIEGAANGRNVFDASFGVFGRFYLTSNEQEFLFAGLTLTNLVEARLDDIANNQQTPMEQGFLQHYLFMTGYRFIPGGDANTFYIEPSLMLRQIPNAPFQADINVRAGFGGDVLVAGLSYRSTDAIGVLLGTDFGNVNNNNNQNSGLKLFYTFDLSTQEFQSYNSGSHEITLAFGFGGNSRNGL
jgi:type IX secretion system PorP/SprF family membrane protein